MKTKRIMAVVLMMVFAGTASMFAQSLSQEEKEELQLRAKQKIEDFQGHLSTIASRDMPQANKTTARKAALNLFIGKGETYQYTDEYGNRLQHEGVKMQVSSKTTGRISSRLMKNYLVSLGNMARYTKVVIENADVVRVDNIHETGDGKYEAVAYFSQKFIGFRDGRILYTDVTEKKVKIYIDKAVVPMPDGNTQIIWKVLLGDIYVVDTY